MSCTTLGLFLDYEFCASKSIILLLNLQALRFRHGWLIELTSSSPSQFPSTNCVANSDTFANPGPHTIRKNARQILRAASLQEELPTGAHV